MSESINRLHPLNFVMASGYKSMGNAFTNIKGIASISLNIKPKIAQDSGRTDLLALLASLLEAVVAPWAHGVLSFPGGRGDAWSLPENF